MKNLIVEGFGDKVFFEKYCEHHAFNVDVTVITPEDIDSQNSTTKSGVIFKSLSPLIQQINVGKIKNLGIIVDADQEIHGSGLERTIRDLTNELEPHGYTLKTAADGFIAEHDDGLINIGIWIMPDNLVDGTIEHWINTLIHPNESNLFSEAKDIVSSLKSRNLQKFKDSRLLKAEIATWFAWQKSPGHGLDFFFNEPLIELNQPNYQSFLRWFKSTFNV